MFCKKYEDRLLAWSKFRQSLETSPTPIQDVIDLYNTAPTVSIHTDPWDQSMWPTPWELVEENQYCEFCSVLGMCYSLQLTERFNQELFEIHIIVDTKNSSTHYALYVGEILIEQPNGIQKHEKFLPEYFEVKKKYAMPKLQ